jgi:hypothetical protein
VLANVLEEHGVATAGISLIRGVTERLRPPRALFCEFPLGRPLGKPRDVAFQHRVLGAVFALLEEPAGPVLADFPERIAQEIDEPLACSVPVPEASGHPAAAEATGLRAAYTRSVERLGRTNVGRIVDAAGVPALLERFARIAAGATAAECGLTGEELMPAASDVRAYYEEAALALSDHVPSAGQADVWLYRSTAAGALLRDARAALRSSGLPSTDWIFIVPQPFWPDFDGSTA